ncbi:nitronate monooxygenase family protein [Thalassotalea fonticola]|uniref:Nitronate monooxygenase family protein n=1 Tax=Thalassotalea fonticola TaxID=3065649 RepID=A0ABZ0GSB9_9GAMM|nr:nitronate monooxygenase family protein [Colwelliaceae bacterium S1-1]
MYTKICEGLGIEFPIFAFSHCRDVVVAVSKAGGLGVLGAGFMNAEQLKEELDWIESHIDGKPYAVDVVIPQNYVGRDEPDLSEQELEDKLWKMVPQAHLDAAEKLMRDHGVPEWPEDGRPKILGWTMQTVMPCIKEALTRPNCKAIVNALGTPPEHVINMVKESGRMIGALCGKKKQAVQHKNAGLDFVVAQGGEGGGHTPEVGSVVLWPEIIDAVHPMPVLAAGGIGNGRQMLAAMSMGAAGVWTGSLWLTVEEAHAQPAQKNTLLNATVNDTVRTTSWTGKGARVLRNEWTDFWDNKENLDPLPMPLHGLVTADAMRRTETYAGSGNCQNVAINICGQVIGQINEIESCRGVVTRLLTQYLDALENVNALMPDY